MEPPPLNIIGEPTVEVYGPPACATGSTLDSGAVVGTVSPPVSRPEWSLPGMVVCDPGPVESVVSSPADGSVVWDETIVVSVAYSVVGVSVVAPSVVVSAAIVVDAAYAVVVVSIDVVDAYVVDAGDVVTGDAVVGVIEEDVAAVVWGDVVAGACVVAGAWVVGACVSSSSGSSSSSSSSVEWWYTLWVVDVVDVVSTVNMPSLKEAELPEESVTRHMRE